MPIPRSLHARCLPSLAMPARCLMQAALCLAAAAIPAEAAEPPRKSIRATRVDAPPVLDGVLDDSAWQFPDMDNADVFVERLVRQGLLVRDVPRRLPERTAQRRTLRSTGLSRRARTQIDRAERAVSLIQRGVPLLEAVWRAGYSDQAHLTRAFKRFVGLTPRQLAESFKTGHDHGA